MAAKKTETTSAPEPFYAFLSDLHALVEKHLGINPGPGVDETPEKDPPFDTDDEPEQKPARKPRAKKEPEPEPESDESDEDEIELDRDALMKKRLPELRVFAKKNGIPADDLKGLDKDAIADLILDVLGDDNESEPESDDDDDEDEPGDEQAERREELEGMKINALRKIAVELGFDKDDVSEADKETLVDSILADEFSDEDGDDDSDDDEDDDESDESETDDDDADESDEDDEGYTEDELNDMSLAELKAIAKAWEIKVRPGTKQAGYVKAILKEQDEIPY